METPGPDPESILVPPETTIIEVEPPTSLVEYTETVERLCKQLDRDKSTKVVLCIRGGPLVVPVCTAAALQRYELALSSRARAVPSSSILEADEHRCGIVGPNEKSPKGEKFPKPTHTGGL